MDVNSCSLPAVPSQAGPRRKCSAAAAVLCWSTGAPDISGWASPRSDPIALAPSSPVALLPLPFPAPPWPPASCFPASSESVRSVRIRSTTSRSSTSRITCFTDSFFFQAGSQLQVQVMRCYDVSAMPCLIWSSSSSSSSI